MAVVGGLRLPTTNKIRGSMQLYWGVCLICSQGSETSDSGVGIVVVYNRHLEAIEDWNSKGQIGRCQECFSLYALSDMKYRLKANLFMSETRIEELADRGFSRMKLAGRNSMLPKFVDMMSRYIFEPTGAIAVVGNEILKEYRMQLSRYDIAIQQYHVPDLIAIENANRGAKAVI